MLFLWPYKERNLDENFLRLYMDGLIAAIRKEDFVKKVNLRLGVISWQMCREVNCLLVHNTLAHVYLRGS